MNGIILGILLILVIGFIIYLHIQIVPKTKMYVVERLGKFHKVHQAGIFFLIPFVDKVKIKLNSQTNYLTIEPIEVETNDNTNNTTQDTIETKPTATIDDIIYPMYLPNNTYLTSQEIIDTDAGERLILTFGGDSSFILVEETVKRSDEGVIIPVTGEFDFLADVIGVIGPNSLSWHSNGIDYYIASDTIPTLELVEIANSVSVLPVSK